MFESFQKQLKIIERDSVCQCGACKTASNLTLKFIAHHGMVQEIKVLQFTKCSGLDMVVAHRLMKNRIASDEYILDAQLFRFLEPQAIPGRSRVGAIERRVPGNRENRVSICSARRD